MLRTLYLSLLLLFASSGSALAAMPGLEWVQEAGRWRLMGEVPKSLDQPGSQAHESAAALMAEARRAQDKGSQWSALGDYEDVIDDYPNTVFAPEAHYQRGVIYTDRHQFESATKEFNAIVRRYPEYPRFNQVISGQFKIGELVQDGARPYYWGFIPGFRDYNIGIDAYEAVVANAPYSEYAPLSLMNLAMVANNEGKPEDAIDALDRLINNYPESLVTPDAYLSLAETYSTLVQGPEYDQDATRQALGFYQDYTLLYPNSEGVYEAEAGIYYMRETLARSQYEMGRFYYLYRNNMRAALVFYNAAITVDPQSSVAMEAREMIEKIEAGVKPPMTPVDWVFGRYQRPSEREYLEQSEVDNLEDESFQIQSTEAFMETPGAMAEEVVGPDGETQEYVGEGFPLDEPFIDGDPAFVEPVEMYDPATGTNEPDMVEPAFGPEFEEGVLEPYQAPGPGTPEQEAVDQFQNQQGQDPNVPAGGN